MSEAAISAPLLSEDLNRFADELEAGGVENFEWTPEGARCFVAGMAGVMRMFALDARALEDEKTLAQARLAAADCRIEALAIPDYLGRTRENIAIREGVAAGRVIDLRAIFRDEQEWAAERREASANDGDAA